jgi:hypothetical protein
VNFGKLQIIAKVKRVSEGSLSRPEGRVCFLSAKEEIFSVGYHGLLAGFQGDQLLQHVPVGGVNQNILAQPLHLQGLLNIFNRGREQA